MTHLNMLSTHAIEVDRTEPYCNRAKLDTGPLCNYNCSFCYYQGDLNKKTDLSVILSRLDYLTECGITEVDLSGGESSLRPDWFELLAECKKRGMKISTVSNGYKFADWDFIKQSKEAGLEEILFSLHGYNAESHNKIVDHRFGWERIIAAINHAKQLGIVVRINCVVTPENYKKLDTLFVDLMMLLHPMEVNFLTLNYWGNTDRRLIKVSYSEVTDHIKKAIDRLNGYIKYINVRYTPYCYMEGYEQHVCNTYQHIYDVFDWNMAVYSGELDPEQYKKDPIKALYAAAAKDRNQSYIKPRDCVSCKYFGICDGMEKQLNEPVRPIKGRYIRQVNFFRKGFYADQCIDTNT